MTRPRIILDCDPGLDDLFAILTALRYCDVVAITTVGGNVGIEHTTRNALGVSQVAGSDVPVHRGADRPYVGDPIDAADVHGDGGLGGVQLPERIRPVASEDAVSALLDLTADGDVLVVAVGPLTNIARAIERDPAFGERIPTLSIMGGSTGAGNVTAAGEFNIWFDPEAAEVVFSSGANILMAGLNLTQQVCMGPPEIERLRAAGTTTATFAADALEFYNGHSLRTYGVPKSAMHDPCAVLAVTHPDLFVSQPMHVVVETAGTHTRGMTLCDHRRNPEPPNTDVLVEAAGDAVVERIMDATISPLG